MATVRIGTHDGTFHCDEAMAIALLKQTHQFSSAAIVRSRDPAVLDALDIIVDVGGVYDPATNRFDHHQRGFNETLNENHTMKLSSAGLVYKHYGREVISALLKSQHNAQVSSQDLETIYFRVYKSFVEALDGIDNGVSQYPGAAEPVYRINTDLSSRVGHLNPSWNEQFSADQLYERFLEAVELTGKEFAQCVSFTYKSWLPARLIVEKALKQRFEVDASGAIVLLKDYTIWKTHLLELEAEMKIETPILYVLYQDTSSKWRIQAVPKDEHSFESRKALPEPWRGVRDAELSSLSGIPDCIFVHASGFIGGGHTYESVIAVAKAAVEFVEPAKKQKVDN